MTVEQRIAAITAALTAIEHTLAQTEKALDLAMTLNDIARLNRQLVTLKARRTRLQFELINLQASQTGIAVMGTAAASAPATMTSAQRKRAQTLARQLADSAKDRGMIDASLRHSDEVLKQTESLQTLLSGHDPK